MATFAVPWSPACLTPNNKRKKHWRVYSEPAKAYRTMCWALALEAGAKGRITRIEFRPPDRRRRDDDGMIGAFKHGRDGIADATKVDDHKFRPEYVFGDPVKGGTVIVTTGEDE